MYNNQEQKAGSHRVLFEVGRRRDTLSGCLLFHVRYFDPK